MLQPYTVILQSIHQAHTVLSWERSPYSTAVQVREKLNICPDHLITLQDWMFVCTAKNLMNLPLLLNSMCESCCCTLQCTIFSGHNYELHVCTWLSFFLAGCVCAIHWLILSRQQNSSESDTGYGFDLYWLSLTNEYNNINNILNISQISQIM